MLAAPAWAQSPSRKLGELELQVLGIQASADPGTPTVPKNVASAVRVVVSAGGRVLDAAEVGSFLQAVTPTGALTYMAEAELSGPGLRQTITIPQLGPELVLPADPLLLPLPPLSVSGDYTISNLRLVVGSRSVLDVQPQRIPLKVIDQILVTAVKTRPLTMDEIREKGIVLDSDDYLGFDFSLGLKLESNVVNVSFPVVFDRQGVAVPLPPSPPNVDAGRGGAQSPASVVPDPISILPVMMTSIPESESAGQSGAPLTLPNGQPIRIPSVLVIPGNVGYFKQFFSAQLFVANGAPVGTPLLVKEVTGKINLPLGLDRERGGDNVEGSDDPLVLVTTVRGKHLETLPVRGVGPDGEPGTQDDVEAFAPGEQGQAEFLLRGDKEGFHGIDVDIRAVLEGLPVGPVKIGGKAQGGVLVRNPRFDVSFTVPAVVRRQEKFKVFMTVSNVGQATANGLTVTLDHLALAGATLPQEQTVVTVPPIAPGQSKVVSFEFTATTTGAVVASYLGFQGDDVAGGLRFGLGVGERGVPLSPDTLALPASVDALPPELVDVAMRVLGQAWSLAGAPPGSLPPGVTRTTRAVVQLKALALAEAGLRLQLGESLHAAVAGLVADFFAPRELDPGFDQLLRSTEAGRDLARALGQALVASTDPAQTPLAAEDSLAKLLASGPDFVSFAADARAPASITIRDALGRALASNRDPDAIGTAAIPGGALLPLGPAGQASFLGLLAHPTASPFSIDVAGPSQVAVTLPRGDGSYGRALVAAGAHTRVVVDLARPDSVTVQEDADGDGTFEGPEQPVPTAGVEVPGPGLLSANLIGPESFAGASQFGTNFALLFDRPVDAAAAADVARYQIPGNQVLAAKRQLTGRLVFGTLAHPEGPHVPTALSANGITDERGRVGEPSTKALVSHLDQQGGGVLIGRVVNADGTPANGGVILYSNTSDSQCDLGADAAAVSAIPLDDEAAYQIRFVSRNKCNMPFELAYQDPRTGALRTVAGLVRYDGERLVMDIALIGRGSVAGTVRNLQGQAVPGASVAVLSETDAHTNKQAVTDGEGRFHVGDVAVGPVSVKAAKGLGLGFGAGRIDRSGNTGVVDVTLDLGAAAKVTGKVYRLEADASHTPLVGELLSYSVQGTIVGYVYSGPGGAFAFENMPSGAFVVAARGGLAAGAPGQQEVNVVIQAQAPGAKYGVVRGRVVLPGGAPASRVIVAHDVSGFMVDGGVALGPGGTFEFPGIKVGEDASLAAITTDRKRTGRTSFRIPDVEPYVLEDVVIQLSGVGDVQFTVFDPSGNPLPNVEVALINPGGPLTRGACANPCGCRAQLTDQDGRATWEDMPLGAVAAQAIRRGAGFFDVVRGTASVTRDGEPGVGVLRFAGTGTVAGQVLYPPGASGNGGEITLTSAVFRNDGFLQCGLATDVSHRAQIDPQTGRFRFTGVNLGPVSVTATNGFFPTPVGASGTLVHNGQELELELKFVNTMAGELTGTVFLPDGLTPSGAGVEVTADGASLSNVVVRTDAGGKFKFAAVLPAGGYTLTARDAATGSVARGNVYLSVLRPAELDLRLKSRGLVRVRVVDGADQPVDQAFVRLTENEFPNKSHEGAIEPASQGVVVFDRVFEGPFSVEAKGPTTGGRASSMLPRIAGSSVDVKVRLAVTGRVEGTFLYPGSGAPVPFGLVTLKTNGRTVGQITTPGSGPDAGRFSFDFVPAGPFRVDGEDPLTTRTGFAVGTIVGQDQVAAVTVVAQGLGTVQGAVTSNGQPWTDGARVTVVSGSFRATTFADGTGHYLISGVPEGRVDVTASPGDGFLAGTASKTLAGDGTDLTIDVALRDSGSLAGRVVEADGETPAPASIVSISVGGAGGGNQSATTDPDGAFRFDRVPAGRATLSVDVLGSVDRALTTVEVRPAETVDVEVALNGVGSISGHARGSNGLPIAGHVQVTGTGPFAWSQAMPVASNGVFVVRDAPAGPFTVALTATEGTFTLYGRASGDVLPDETTSIDVRLQETGKVTGVVRRADGTKPAVGAEVTLELDGARGSVRVYAGNDGAFEALGVPTGRFHVRVFDPVTTGRVFRLDNVATTAGVQLAPLILDESAPSLAFLEPQAGITRARFAGPLVLELGNTADLDPDSLYVLYPNGAAQLGLVVANNRVASSLVVGNLKVGRNVLRARVKDRTGNEGETEVGFTLTGGTLHGQVLYANGSPALDVPVQIHGLPELRTDETNGTFSKPGVAPGVYTVSATDPVTGFRKVEVVTLPDGESQSATVEVRLPAYGTILGTVLRASGAPAFGVKVQLGSTEVTTGAGGRFTIHNVATDTDHSLRATDTNEDTGSAVVRLTRHGQEEPVTISLNGVGSVEVLVRQAGGQPSAGATVTLTGGLGSVKTGPTNSLGKVSFTDVLAGGLSAVATDLRGVVGSKTGFLPPDGSVPLTIDLAEVARVQGQVTHHDGSVAPGVTVDISGAGTGSTVSGPGGSFAFENVPKGPFQLTAREPETEDRGHAEGAVMQDGQPVTVPLALIGTGAVHATVTTAGGVPVSGAQVHVSWDGRFGATRSAVTDGAGVATVGKVLAGQVSVTGRKDALATNAVTTSVTSQGSTPVSLQLEGTGTARGVVYEPDGATPAHGVRVGIGVGNPGAFVTTGADGVYEFTDLRRGVGYSLFASRNERLRAAASVVLSDGAPAGPDMTLVGVGTVTGILRDAAGVPVIVHSVTLSSAIPVFGGLRFATTDFAGRFTFTDVPVGGAPVGFTLVATRGSERADGEGKVAGDGQTVPLDLKFLPSAVTLPYALSDGNGWRHLLPSADGRVDVSGNCIIFGPGGALRLSLVHQGSTLPFVGSGNTVTTEENKRELVFRQTLAGLDVQRKVFVPRYGYFARAMDTLTNPSDAPVVVDVAYETYSDVWRPGVVASSSGDAQASVADRWVALDDAQQGGSGCQFPPLALAFGGAGASAAATLAVHESTASTARFKTRWDSLTIPAHGSVALLHALSAQTTRARASATGERLAGLPPELLEGLTLEESEAIVNFAVPVDLASSLAPLPPLDGEVSGRVFSGDGTTAVPQVSGTFESRSMHYGVPITFTTALDGSFRVAPDLAGDPPRVVPREGYDLAGSFTGVGQVFTLQAEGTFAPGQQFAAQDLVFSGTGSVEGRVLRAAGDLVSGAGVRIDGPSGWQFALGNTGSTAERFRFPVVAPGAAGTYTITAAHPLGGVTAVADDFSVAAGQKTARDVVFASFGSLDGTVRTAGLIPFGAWLTLTRPDGFSRTVRGTGPYAFLDLPEATYTLKTQDDRNGAVVSQQVAVTAGPATHANVTLAPVGRVEVTAAVAGEPLSGGRAFWQSAAYGPGFYPFPCSTTAAGSCTLVNVSGPDVRIRVEYPGVPDSYGEASVSLSEGQTVPAQVSVPGVGSVTGFIRSRNGVVLPAPGLGAVSIYHATENRLLKNATMTDAAGRYTFGDVPVGPLRIRVWRDANNAKGEVSGTLALGATLDLDVVEPWGVLAAPSQADAWQATFAAGEAGSLVVTGLALGEEAPLADPTVEVYGPDGVLLARHDDTSAATVAATTFTTNAAGRHLILVRTKGAAGGGYRLGSALQNDAHVFRVHDGPSLGGRVLREGSGAPVAGQRVRASLGGLTLEAASAADGGYTIPIFTSGAATVEALDADGIVVASASVDVPEPASSVTVDLEVPVRGNVVASVLRAGQGFAGVAVELASDHASALAGDKNRTRTSSTAGTAAASLPVGNVTATVYDALRGVPVTASGVLAADATLPLSLTLAAPTTVRGTVRGSDGSALVGATVTLSNGASATTGPTGQYAIAGVAPGQHDATAAYGEESASQTLNAPFDGGDVLADFTLDVDGEAAALPTDGLSLWLRADEGVQREGDRVVSWADQSPAGNHAAPPSVSARPRWLQEAGSGTALLRFDGTDDAVHFATPLSTIRSVFWVVAESPSATGGYRSLLGHASAYDFGGGFGAPGPLWLSGWTPASVVDGQAFVNGAPVDGLTAVRPRALSVVSAVTTGNAAADRFGTAPGGGFSPWWGDLAELIVYDRPLTAEERQTIQNYLLSKYQVGPSVLRPLVSPHGGILSGSSSVTLQTATPGAQIRYTTDGAEPTETSPLYGGALRLHQTTTLKAKAFRSGAASETVTAGFISSADVHPGTFGGLSLWWRADAGVPSALGDLWRDQSGRGNHGMQTSGAAIAQLVQGAANGLPAMRFDGSNDFVHFSTPLSSIRTVFWVASESAAATAGYRSLLGDAATYDFGGGFGAPGPLWLSGWVAASVVDGQTFVNGTSVSGLTSLRPRELSLISVATTGNATADRFGTAPGGGFSPWWGDLAELIVYDRALTDGERLAVENYLNARYDVIAPRGLVSVTARRAGVGVFGVEVLVASDHPTAPTAEKNRIVFTDETGAASVGMPVGNVTASAYDPWAQRTALASGALAANGTLQLELALAAPTTFLGVVRAQDGSALPGVAVTLSTGQTTTSSASGQYAISSVPPSAQPYTLTASLGGQSSSRQVTAAFDGGDVSVDFALPFASAKAAIRGRVVTADASRPLPGATVYLYQGNGYVFRGQVFTDALGGYEFAELVPDAYHLYAYYGNHALTDRVAQVAGADVLLELALPSLRVLRGRVREAGGSAVPDARVEVCIAAGPCYASQFADAGGGYELLDLPQFDHGTALVVRARAADGSDWPGEAGFTFDASATAFEVDVELAPSGTVVGTLRTAEGEPLAERWVLLTNDWDVYRYAQTDAAGGYTIRHLAAGDLRGYVDVDGIPASGQVVAALGETRTLDLTLPATATLMVSLVDVAGNGQTRQVTVQAPETSFQAGEAWQTSVWTRRDDEQGACEYDPNTDSSICTGPPLPVAVRVPAGWYRAIFAGGRAAAEGDVAPGEVRSVRLVLGSHIERSDGPSGVFVSSTIPGLESFPPLVRPEQAGRAMRSLTATGGGVRVRRHEFVPVSGAFTRTLLHVANPGSAPLSVDVATLLPLGNPSWALLLDSSGDEAFDLTDHFLVANRADEPVVDDDPLPGDPVGTARGLVFGSALVPSAVAFSGGAVEPHPDSGQIARPGSIAVSHSLTIPAGEARALLIFASSSESLQAQPLAESLASLSAPEALAGLSAAERRLIANFTMPPTNEVAGVVRSAGGVGVANATVAAVRDGVQVGEATADAAGFYTLALDAGDHVIVALDPATNRPGRRTVTVAVGTTTPADVALLADAEIGSVRVVGADEGERIQVEAPGYAPSWRASATIQDAAATIEGVPLGPVIAHVVGTPSLRAQGTLDAGVRLELTLARVGLAAIRGQVLDTNYGPLANVRVALFRHPEKLTEVTSDGEGRFSFTGLVEGQYLVAALDPETRLTGGVWPYVSETDELDIQVVVMAEPEMASVRVRGVLAANGQPASGVGVTVESLLYPGFWVEQLTLDANGEATAVNVPTGDDVRVFVTGAPSVQEFVYPSPGSVASITLRVGEQRTAYPVELTGSDGVPYFAFPSEVQGTGETAWVCVPFCTGQSRFGSMEVSPRSTSALLRETAEGRESIVRAWSDFGLQGERRTFVPAGGGFVRTLDVLENTTDSALDVSYLFQQSFEPGWTVSGSSSSDAGFDAADDYVTQSHEDASLPEVAWVVWGANASLQKGEVFDGSWYGSLYVVGSVTLPPHQKAVLMRFTTQLPHGQDEDVRSLAEALRALDPSIRDTALALMTAEEKAALVNFVVPQP